MSTVYLDGEYVAKERAKVSVDDRGFLLSDGLYEVTPAYRGRLFLPERHVERLRVGLGALKIQFDTRDLPDIHQRLLAVNSLVDAEACFVYLQVTRGVAPRTHAFPTESVPPTVYAFAREFTRAAPERWARGFSAVTVPDRRWARVDIKSTGLLANVLAQQAAVAAGASDALLVRDGVALEGANNNFFAVFDGVVTTHPATNAILPGITRGRVLELAASEGVPALERAIQVEELVQADEVFFTGTTTEIRPCVSIDGRDVGDGEPGPLTRRLFDAFCRETGVGAGAPAG